MTVARDFVNREIKAGDTIAYPVRRGSKMWLNRLTVQQIVAGPKGLQVGGVNSKGRRVTVTNLTNVVVAQPWRCELPIYVYECAECGHSMEEMQGVNDPELRKCPECGKPELKRQITSAQLHMRYSLMAPRHMRGQRKR